MLKAEREAEARRLNQERIQEIRARAAEVAASTTGKDIRERDKRLRTNPNTRKQRLS